MATLQIHQAKALKQVHEGSTDPGLMQELGTATDFALRATKVTARSLGKEMSTMVVQERHLWLNLVEMKDVDKAHVLDAPISQAGLFGNTVEGFAQQFSAVQQQTEAIQHTCPGMMHHPPLPPGPGPGSVCLSPWAPSCILQSCSASGRIDTLAGASSLSQESGAPHVPARPRVVHEVDEAALTWATRRFGKEQKKLNLLFLRRRREQRRSFPWWRAGRRIFRFCSVVHTF